MAYDESVHRRRDDDGTDPGGIGAQDDSSDQPDTQRLPPALEDIFDDPAHGEPGRDRMGIHAVWEVVLLVGVAVLALLIYRDDPGALRGTALNGLLVSAAALGLLALAAGLTLRAGVPNLALGPVAIASALHFAEQGDLGTMAAIGPAAAAAGLLGLALALFVVGFHVPSWAASLAVAFAIGSVIVQRSAPVDVQADYDPSQHAIYLFGGFAALSVLGGLLGLVKAVRRTVGRFRSVADPAWRRGAGAGVLAAMTLVLSMGLAMLAGVLLAAGGDGTVRPVSGFEWSGLALGTALLAGTSAFGRRGGVFGTVLAVALLTLFDVYADARGWNIALAVVAAVTIAVGLVATRLVESYGRPRWATVDGDEGEESETDSIRDDRRESWSSALPAQPTDSRADLWSGDRWSAGDR